MTVSIDAGCGANFHDSRPHIQHLSFTLNITLGSVITRSSYTVQADNIPDVLYVHIRTDELLFLLFGGSIPYSYRFLCDWSVWR